MHHLRRILVLVCLGLLLAPGLARAQDPRVFWNDQKNYVALKDIAAAYNCKVSGPVARRITLQSKWVTLVFTTDGRELTVNGTQLWLHEPMQSVRGRWCIREVDFRSVLDPIIRPDRYLRQSGYRVIVLDPGHGGQDTGAKGVRGVEEKRVVLDIARRMRVHLANAGFTVYLTRDGDRFIDLEERSRRAARWGADLFVSVHINSAASATASGTETYNLAAAGFSSTAGGARTGAELGNRHEAANAMLAYQIQRALVQQAGTVDRGVKKSRFMVLKNAPCPAVLVECGFVSNRREEERLMDENFREALAQGMVRGVLNHVNMVKRAQLAAP